MGKKLMLVCTGVNSRTFFFLIYMNNLIEGISSTAKLFADDTSLFSVVQNNNSASQINDDLDKVSDWAYTWKMSFNPDPSKQAKVVTVSRKCTKEDHPSIYFNDITVTRLPFKNIS